ncbi:unnamed protein product [Caenorhabditis nigoni]
MPRPILGIISIFYGSIMEIQFIPCLLAMLDKDLWRLSCYKIMFFVGIVDMMALAMNSISTGVLAYEGAVFCTHPVFIYLAGLCGLGLWCCSCLMNIMLLVNRTLNVANSSFSERLFEGFRTYLWLLVPIIYGLYFIFFTPTCVFSSKYYAWFYDPFIFPNRTSEYTNVAHGVNNFMIMCGTFVFYGYICYVLCKANKAGRKSSRIHIQSYQILYQSVAICFINQVSSSVYVVMNFATVPEWLIVVAQLMWQLDHGCPVIIYMTMNPTIRSGCWREITFRKRRISSVQTTTIRPFQYRDV